MDGYNHAKNGLANGWAIVLSALLLNAAFFLWHRQSPAYAFGALSCFVALGSAYLGEGMVTGALPIRMPPRAWLSLLILLRLIVIVAPCVAWALWFSATVR